MKKRGSALTWILVVLVLVVIGVIAYVLIVKGDVGIKDLEKEEIVTPPSLIEEVNLEAKIIEKDFNELTFIKVEERNTNEGSDKSGLYRDNEKNNYVRVVISVTNSKDKARDTIEDIIEEVVVNHKFNKEEKTINKNKVIWTEEYRDNEQGLETIVFWRSDKNVISLNEYLRDATENTEGYTNLGSKELLNAYLKKYSSDL